MRTTAIREVLQISQQQLHRLTLAEDFPARIQISRSFWVNPEGLLAFARRWNNLCDGIPASEVASLIRSTMHTARRLMRSPDFPQSLGLLNGRDRWDRAAIIEWHRKRGDGAKLPPGADVVPDRAAKKKKPPTLKAVSGGKARRQ